MHVVVVVVDADVAIAVHVGAVGLRISQVKLGNFITLFFLLSISQIRIRR